MELIREAGRGTGGRKEKNGRELRRGREKDRNGGWK